MRLPTVRRALISFLVLSCLAGPALADVTLPSLFSDHMVLQQQAAIPVWGWADPGEAVTVTLGGQKQTATACSEGKWSVRLTACEAGGPLTLVVKGKNTIQIADVLVGETWLCSGQSNMAMSVASSANFEEEKAAADHPQLRMFTVSRVTAETPQERCQGTWQVCRPDTVGGFSATAYFFGRELHRQLKVPVGLINSSWGGTPVQAWTSLAVQQALPELKPILDNWDQQIKNYDPEAAKERFEKQLAAWQSKAKQAKQAGQQPPRRPQPPVDPRVSPHRPASLYNGMIEPLAPYALRGAIWYQGESNAGGTTANLYGLQLATMIGNWRKRWGQGDFPFGWVQLPNFRAPQQEPVETSGWVIVQEQMLKTLAVTNTGMAITIDVGEANDIHPKNKQDVGKRLALWALATIHDKQLVYSGPLYKSMSQADGKISIRFDHVGDGLKAKGEKLTGFAIAGEDRKFVFADAKIEGTDTVVVCSDQVAKPVAVRYAWASNPDASLFNSAGLPASPFRTDTWETP
ncbi:MAG TPA: sialate O-acetylesterase [Candidatus Anammoximicrobium sp.]|nr:sialate O-acetylesterase [Candidatus Anammoximicrobium sp.]